MPDYGYDVREPYVCMDSAHSDENRIVFVSNGDGTGELYAAGSTGLPILTQQSVVSDQLINPVYILLMIRMEMLRNHRMHALLTWR